MNKETTVTIKVPRRFWDDHTERECIWFEHLCSEKPSKGNIVEVTLSVADVADLYSDADYYGSQPEEFGRALAKSADRTKEALDKLFTRDELRLFQSLLAEHEEQYWAARKAAK